MKHKTKLIATLMAMCLVITLGVFGILAVKTLNMSVGGNITFSAEGVSLIVSPGEFKTTDNKDYSSILTQEGKLQGFTMNTDTKLSDVQDKINSWAGLELVMDSKGDAVLHFSVKNNMTTPLYVYIETNLGTNLNDNMELDISAENGTPIGAGETIELTVVFDILDININAGLTGFSIGICFEMQERGLKVQNKIDANGNQTSEVDYYYVEMGTYNGQPVRWRYVADSSGIRYDGSSKVTSLSGYYVIDTVITTTRSFLNYSNFNSSTGRHNTYTSIYCSDYGVSDIRAYLRNEGSGGFMANLKISTSDEIYGKIQARTITDLYSNIKENGGAITASDTNYSLSLTGADSIIGQSDKFWLMSAIEAKTFFADNASRQWGYRYWTRSPYSYSSSNPIRVGTDGVVENGFYASNDGRVRACFKI